MLDAAAAASWARRPNDAPASTIGSTQARCCVLATAGACRHALHAVDGSAPVPNAALALQLLRATAHAVEPVSAMDEAITRAQGRSLLLCSHPTIQRGREGGDPLAACAASQGW